MKRHQLFLYCFIFDFILITSRLFTYELSK